MWSSSASAVVLFAALIKIADSASPKIIGGSPARDSQFPYHVRINLDLGRNERAFLEFLVTSEEIRIVEL